MGDDLKHLALFVTGLNVGGAQSTMLMLARAFAERGHRVDLVAARSSGPMREHVPPAVRLVALDSESLRWHNLLSHKGFRAVAAAPAMAAYLRRERPDLVLAHSNPPNLCAVWAKRLGRVETPIVVTVNTNLTAATAQRPGVLGPLLREFARRCYPWADACIATSDGVADDLSQLAKIPRPHITTIYNPVDSKTFQEKATEPLEHPWFDADGPPVVVTVGKLEPQKDYPTLVRAFSRVRQARQARLVFVGEGPVRPQLEALIRELGLESDVMLMGFVENQFPYMAKASVFVLSSAWEGFSNVLSEALACGSPVVSTDCPSGPAELLDHGGYGPLAPVGDDEALAKAILSVLAAPPDPERQRQRAATFSIDATVDRYLELFQEVCQNAS